MLASQVVVGTPLQTPKFSSQEKDEEATRCELFGWSPKWIQRFARIHYYAIVYGLLGLGDFAIGSYMVATITTIEKRFKISSRMSGMILSAWDVGAILSMLTLTYIGSKGRRSRWVAAGAVNVSLSCIIRLLPHLKYGPGEHSKLFVGSVDPTSNLTGSCETGPIETCLSGEAEGNIPALLFAFANFVIGIGTSTYYTLGIAYMDDNSNKNKVPLLLASVFCIRMFGPTLGFMLASYCLKIYVDPVALPSITDSDPRWIGAWWIGWIPLALMNLILALFMMPFPQYFKGMPRPSKKETNISTTEISLKDFKLTLTRLVKNKVLVFNSISSTFYMFGMSGYWSFMPKYLETQFNQSASKASFISGSIGLACTAMGIIASGLVITRLKPRPQYLAAWNVLVECIEVMGQISFAFLGCPTENYQGHWNQEALWNMTDSCNVGCSCRSDIKYTPLCSADGSVSFYSPCHAGCTTSTVLNNTKLYGNCSCSSDGAVLEGVCPIDCSRNFIIFFTVLCLLRFFGASGRAGNTILQFRAVKQEDKSVSIAFSELMVSAFAFIPAPIFYGALLDSTCLVWGETCGEPGNCWLYDGQTLRYYLNFTGSGFVFLAMIADIGVWWNSHTLKIYDEEDKTKDGGAGQKVGEELVSPEAVPFVEKNRVPREEENPRS